MFAGDSEGAAKMITSSAGNVCHFIANLFQRIKRMPFKNSKMRATQLLW